MNTRVSCMMMTPIENILEKGQKNGDATKVVTSAEIATIDEQVPKIDVDVKFHEVRDLDNKKRKDRRALQKAIIAEQEKAEKDLVEGR